MRLTCRNLAISMFGIIGLSVLALFSFGIFVMYNSDASVAQEIERSLIVIDQHFDSQRVSLSASEPDSNILPLQVGNYQRANITDCGIAPTEIVSCKSTGYTRLNQPNSQISVRAEHIAGNVANVLPGAMAQPKNCSPENVGENHLRSVGSYQYLYRICHLSLIQSTGSLIGVTWVNGDWLLSINVCICGENNLNNLAAQFVNDYPN